MCAVSNIGFFCGSIISCFPVMLHKYSLGYFEMDPVAPIITGITFDSTLHIR